MFCAILDGSRLSLVTPHKLAVPTKDNHCHQLRPPSIFLGFSPPLCFPSAYVRLSSSLCDLFPVRLPLRAPIPRPRRQMRNFLFQVGLAYYRLGDSATALECFERAEKEELRRRHSGEDSITAPLNRRWSAAGPSSEGFDEPSLHYHR